MRTGEETLLRNLVPMQGRGHGSFFMRCLSLPARDALEHIGTSVDLPKGNTIFGPNLPPDCIYFLTAGVAAIIATASEEKATGCALIGREGYLLPAGILGADRIPNQCRMMSAGRALRVERSALLALQQERPQLQQVLLKFAYVMICQMMATSLSQAADPIPKRLARLILMMFDRLASVEILLSHADCAVLLGVRRASVTDAMHVLEGDGLISNVRGTVLVVNRIAMLRLVGTSYGRPENEHNRLIGPYF